MQLESPAASPAPTAPTPFQSHIGAIRILANPLVTKHLVNFNPTLVQLELFVKARSRNSVVIFQSHIGAIRIDEKRESKNQLHYFNPTLVQLESPPSNQRLSSMQNFNPTLVQLE